MSGGVRQWGKDYWVYSNDDTNVEVTHLCLDGGKLHVPFKSVPYFHCKVGSDIAKGIRNYIVECRTEVFKFHADIDLYEPVENDGVDVLKWVRSMLCVMREFYPGMESELNVVVCTTETAENVSKGGCVYNKTGIHLLFPWLLTNTEQSMILRNGMIQYFIATYGERGDNCNPWSDVFDKTVYLSNGLRMLGCAKMERCKECKGQFGLVCAKCDGKGKYDIGRIYKPLCVLNGVDGSNNEKIMDDIMNDEIYMTNLCSIRCDPAKITKECMPLLNIPSWYDESVSYEDNKVQTYKRRDVHSQKVVKIEERENRVKLSDTDIRVIKIKEWFGGGGGDELNELFKIPDVYTKDANGNNVVSVMMCTPTFTDRYYIINVTSRYCSNIGKEHNSNGIYFVMNENGMYQKCFCRCQTTENRISGKRCEEYSSDVILIPDDIMPLLFASKEDKMRLEYAKFMESCNNSLTNINDERQLIRVLLSRME